MGWEDYAVAALKVLAGLAWPGVAAFALIRYHTQLSSLLGGLTLALTRADTLTLAGVSVKLSKDFIARTSEPVKAVLKRMTAEDIEGLMKYAGTKGYFSRNPAGDTDEPTVEEVRRLHDLGLLGSSLEGTVCATGTDENGAPIYETTRTRFTALGQETHQTLRRLLADVVHLIARSDA